jgi:predicted nucleotidyltransferase
MHSTSANLKSPKAGEYLDMAKSIVLNHIPNDEYAIFLFGSRVNEKNLRYSDIDIGIYGKTELPLKIKAAVEEALNESIVHFDVELVDFTKVSETFKDESLQNISIWSNPKNLMISLKH